MYISWFNPFNDELLYSAIGRTQRYNALSMLTTQDVFFGSSKAQPKFLIPSNLDYFSEAFKYSPDYILAKHSVYNYFAPFAFKEAQEKAMKQFLSCNNNYSPAKLIGLIETNTNRIKMKYCSSCIIEDINKFGVPYFHVSHNLQGITVCYKHGNILKDYITTHDGSYIAFDVDDTFSNKEQEQLPNNNHYLKLAQLAYELINSDITGLDRTTITARIKTLIRKEGWVRPNGHIDQTRFAQKIKEFYGVDFLIETGNIITDNLNCWKRRITRNTGALIRPIQYLIVIRMFVDSLSEFIQIKPELELDRKKVPSANLKSDKKLLLSHKRRLLAAKRWHPDWIRTDFKKNCMNAYQYVYKYENQWIDKWLPTKIERPTKAYFNKEYDKQLDEYYLNLIKQEYARLIHTVPIVRITKYTLEKAIGKPGLFKPGQYIMCDEYLQNIIESTQDVRLRKCKIIADEFFDIGVIPTIQQIRNGSKLKEIERFGPLINDIKQYVEANIDCKSIQH